MDAFANGLRVAAAIRAEGEFSKFVKDRYSSFDSGIGKEIDTGSTDFEKLEAYMLQKGEVAPNKSGRQEMLENLFNRYL
jgi:xylose isomerase